MLTYDDFLKIMNIGIELTTENDKNKLLAGILQKGMEITNCDAGTLYLYKENALQFKIMKTLSMGVSRGEDGEEISSMPPVPMKEDNVCAYTAIHREIINIGDVYHSETFDFSGPKRYDALTGYRTQSMLVVPLENTEGDLLGVLQMINAMDEQGKLIPFDKEYEMVIRALGSLTAIALTNIRYLNEMKLQLHSFVEAMATAIDQRTPYNGSHTRKVAEYALLLADKINEKENNGEIDQIFDEDRKEKLGLAALLHDIGKMIIPLSVMNRSTRLDREKKSVEDRFALLEAYVKIDILEGRLDKEEGERRLLDIRDALEFVERIDAAGFLPQEDIDKVQVIASMKYVTPEGKEIPFLTPEEQACLSVQKGTLTDEMRKTMEGHVEMTSRILDKVYFNSNYRNVPKWAGQHHEFLNGTGYPGHLTADDLDLESRILTVTDIYDALTATDRPYKKPMSKEKALDILYSMAEEGKVEKRLVDWLGEALADKGTP